jgi:hypothetical protein
VSRTEGLSAMSTITFHMPKDRHEWCYKFEVAHKLTTSDATHILVSGKHLTTSLGEGTMIETPKLIKTRRRRPSEVRDTSVVRL